MTFSFGWKKSDPNEPPMMIVSTLLMISSITLSFLMIFPPPNIARTGCTGSSNTYNRTTKKEIRFQLFWSLQPLNCQEEDPLWMTMDSRHTWQNGFSSSSSFIFTFDCRSIDCVLPSPHCNEPETKNQPLHTSRMNNDAMDGWWLVGSFNGCSFNNMNECDNGKYVSGFTPSSCAIGGGMGIAWDNISGKQTWDVRAT